MRRSAKLLKKRAAGEGTPCASCASTRSTATARCTHLALRACRWRAGASAHRPALAERLEDELDAHVSFLCRASSAANPAKPPERRRRARRQHNRSAMMEANAELLARAQALFAARRAARRSGFTGSSCSRPTSSTSSTTIGSRASPSAIARSAASAKPATSICTCTISIAPAEVFTPAGASRRGRARQGARGAAQRRATPPRSCTSSRRAGYAEAGRHVLVGGRVRAGRHRRATSGARGSACCAIRGCAATPTKRRWCTSTSASPAQRDGDKDARQPPPRAVAAPPRAGRRRLRDPRRARARVRLLPDPAQARQGLGQFENLAEGYVNCIRVLSEDNLKFYVLQYYEDFIKLALERGEFHAAATLYHEAADYARARRAHLRPRLP